MADAGDPQVLAAAAASMLLFSSGWHSCCRFLKAQLGESMGAAGDSGIWLMGKEGYT